MANGRIEIDIGVDPSEAAAGLAKIDQALELFQNQISKSGQDFLEFTDDVDASAKQISEQMGVSFKDAKKQLVSFRSGLQDTGKALETDLNPKTDDAIKGLDSLKGGAGEVSSSFGQFGAAVGVLSPELGGMASQVGALAGGLEGASKMTKLTGGSLKTLAIAGGSLAVVAGTLGAAWKMFSSRLNAANERIRESHIAMEEGVKQAKTYKFTIQTLNNQLGLLSDAEFAVIDARKKSKEHTAEEVKAQEAKRILIKELIGDIQGLSKFEKELAEGRSILEKRDRTSILTTRNISKAMKDMNAQAEKGIEIDRDAGLSSIRLFSGKKNIAKALKLVRAEIENTQGMLSAYQGEVDGTARRTETLNLKLQIQAAQAREDTEAIRNLALSLAILEDVEARLAIAALKAAEATAILQAQMMNLGPATAASITAIKKLFDALEDDAAPVGFKTTLAQLNKKLKGTEDATDDVTTATKDATEAIWRGEEAADALAQARGRAAVIERDYAKAIATANELRASEAVSEEGLAELIAAAWDTRVAAVKEGEAEIQSEKDAALAKEFEDAQKKIDLAQSMTDQISSIISASMEKRASAIDADEANALAAAEGNSEKQEKIRQKFDKRRKSELSGLFKAQQATEIATTLMSGASAGIGALAPPPTGLGPVAGIPLAAFVAAATAAQIGLIASQQPAFHQGGIVGGQGDQSINAQGGEVVLNREAVAAMGGAAAANGLNQGGGGGGVIVVQNVYKQRVFDAVIADNLAKGGPLKSALNNATRTGRRGRVGGLL